MTSESGSISIESATDVGMGLGEVVLSGCAAYGCSQSVLYVGTLVENAVRWFWEKPNIIPTATPGRSISLAPADLINTEPVIHLIRACTASGNKASIVVGFTETLFQLYRYTQSDHTKSWATDMIEGGYRGAAVGAITGFSTNEEALPQKIASAIINAIVGCAVGNGIACVGRIFRSIHTRLPPDKVDEDQL